MSLESGIIIANTTGIITSLAEDANKDKGRASNEEDRIKQTASSIRRTQKTYPIAIGRANCIPLEELVSPDRIASDDSRKNIEPERREGGFYEGLGLGDQN